MSVRVSSQCSELLPIKLKLSGSAVPGVDYIIQHNNDSIPIRALTTNEHLVEIYLFNNSSVFDFYAIPIAYNSTNKKTITVTILDEPSLFFTKVRSANITLNKSVSFAITDFETLPSLGTTLGVDAQYEPEVDLGETNTHTQISYPVIEPQTEPVIQFAETFLTYTQNTLSSVQITRTGDLSQNSVVHLYLLIDSGVVGQDFIVDSEYYIIFRPYQDSKLVNLATFVNNSVNYSLLLEPHINSTIGLNSQCSITATPSL